MVTYIGYIETVLDALLILEACRIGKLNRATRRPAGKEQSNVQSGTVYVWDEDETGIQRWTDGRRWSSSRPRGNFIVYRELNDNKPSKHYNSNSGTAVGTSHGLYTPSYEYPMALSEISTIPDKSLSVLTSSGRRLLAKQDGLIKKALSVKIADGRRLHLVSYYCAQDVVFHKLIIPRFDPMMKSISIPSKLYPVLAYDIGNDGQKIYRFAMAQGRGRAEVTLNPDTGPQTLSSRTGEYDDLESENKSDASICDEQKSESTQEDIQHRDHHHIPPQPTDLTTPATVTEQSLIPSDMHIRTPSPLLSSTQPPPNVQLPPMSNLLVFGRDGMAPIGNDVLPPIPTIRIPAPPDLLVPMTQSLASTGSALRGDPGSYSCQSHFHPQPSPRQPTQTQYNSLILDMEDSVIHPVCENTFTIESAVNTHGSHHLMRNGAILSPTHRSTICREDVSHGVEMRPELHSHQHYFDHPNPNTACHDDYVCQHNSY